MGLTDTFFGKPGTTTYQQTPGTRDPGYGFAQKFFNWLGGLMGTPYPQFQGSIDPGMSPTMQDAIRRGQGYAQSSPAEILQGAQGSLGRFMNANFLNPVNELFGGAPNYFGVNPNQTVYGGQPAGNFTWQAGAWGQPQQPQQPWGQQPQQQPQQPAAPQGNWLNWQSPQMSQPMSMAQPDQGQTSRMAQYQAANAQFNPSWAGTTDPNVFNSQPFLDYNRQFQNLPFHATEQQSAMERVYGRPVSIEEAQPQWMAGNTEIIDQARNLFLQDAPTQFTGANSRLDELIRTHGVAQGSQMFDAEQGG